MDFYGFSNGVEQANALNMGSALANNAYDRMNTGLLGNANIKKVNQDQKVIDADNQDVGTAQTTSDRSWYRWCCYGWKRYKRCWQSIR